MVLANAQGILHFSSSCPDYYFTHILPSRTWWDQLFLQTAANHFCWFSDAFWYVHLEYLEPVVYTWWALVLWGPCMPWKACLLFWHQVLPWLHKTPPLAMLWPSCAACSLLNCWCTNSTQGGDAMMQAAASNDPSMFITALLFTEQYWLSRNIIIRNYEM